MARTVVVDTSVLINFGHLDRLDLLAAVPGVRLLVPAEVEAEIVYPDQVERFRVGVERGWVGRVEVSDVELAGVGYLERVEALRRRRLDLGEAVCLALAAALGWAVACDERGLFLRLAEETLGRGRVTDTPGLLLSAIRVGSLDVAAADRAKASLEAHRYRMAFASFADLLP